MGSLPAASELPAAAATTAAAAEPAAEQSVPVRSPEAGPRSYHFPEFCSMRLVRENFLPAASRP